MQTFITFLLFVLVFWLIGRSNYNRDSTDLPSPKSRSGLCLYVDRATGVHYVKGGLFGGTTPRLNADGSLYIDKGE